MDQNSPFLKIIFIIIGLILATKFVMLAGVMINVAKKGGMF